MTDTAPDSAPQAGNAGPSWVRSVVDFGGLAAFLVTYLVAVVVFGQPKAEGLVTGTWGLVAGSAAALILGYAVERRIAPLPLFGGVVALVFGVLTLIFHDPIFIKIKATIINVALGCVMLGSLMLKKNPLRQIFSGTLDLSESGWRSLTLRFGLFYLCMAALNELVWRTQTETVWVFFRFPGLQVITLLFVLTQLPMLMKDAKMVQKASELEP